MTKRFPSSLNYDAYNFHSFTKHISSSAISFFFPNRDFINKFQSSRFPCIHGGGILMETKVLDSFRSLAMFKNNFKLKW